MKAPLRVFVIAGELSGDQLGAHVMAGLKTLEPTCEFHGVGGPKMAAEGLQSLFDMNDLSVMGIFEVLPRLPRLLRRIRQTVEAIDRYKPDILLTIDSPDFCLRVAQKARRLHKSLATVHYVAPSVWAWRPERAAQMAPYIDHVLALLPFEPDYMKAAGMTCDFVGHPIAGFPRIETRAAAEFRVGLGIAPSAKVLCMLPGSRRSEISHHRDVFLEVLARLDRAMPGLRTIIPVAPSVRKEVHAAFADAPTRPVLFDPPRGDEDHALRQKLTAYKASDAALAVSGTVSLELASQGVPMVIAYTTGRLSQWIIRRKFLLDTATLVNLVSETRAVPEFIFDRFDPDLIEAELLPLLRAPESAGDQQDAARITMERLGRGGDAPELRAARSILTRFG